MFLYFDTDIVFHTMSAHVCLYSHRHSVEKKVQVTEELILIFMGIIMKFTTSIKSIINVNVVCVFNFLYVITLQFDVQSNIDG